MNLAAHGHESARTAKRSTSTSVTLPVERTKLEERMRPTMRKVEAARDRAREKARKYIWVLAALNVFGFFAAMLGVAATGKLVKMSPQPSSRDVIILGGLFTACSMLSFVIALYFLFYCMDGSVVAAFQRMWELEAFVGDLSWFIVKDNSSVTALLELEKTVAHDTERYRMIEGGYACDRGTLLFWEVLEMLTTWRTTGVASEEGECTERSVMRRDDTVLHLDGRPGS